MGDPITGAAVSGLVKLLFDKLGSPFFKEIELSFGMKSELKRMRRTLSAIDAVLLDAEEQQTNLSSVRDWLLNLKDVAYDIEDFLDVMSTQALENQVRQKTLVRKVGVQFPHLSLAKKLKDICGRLEEISANRMDFNFQERQVSTVAPPAHTAFIQESSVFGSKEDQNRIVSHLVGFFNFHGLFLLDKLFCKFYYQRRKISEIQVVPIVGMGGMGKTTLAKLVFNDPRVNYNFSLKLWASLPKEFSKKTAIEKIFECATGGNASSSNLQAIEKTVHDLLDGKTFLLVLDNVWASTPSILSDRTFLKEWTDLKEFLGVGSISSRIIVTTREDMVVSIVGPMEAYKLQPLSDDACWLVFAKYAFGDGKEKEWPSLVEIGKEIVRKCSGVPLAARTWGSQLWNVRELSDWKRIEESELWKMEQAPDDILPTLKLSFDQLPYYLKPCFSFCSIMSKPHFYRVEMEHCWMALGLTESRDMNGSSGTTYFNQLVSRSFFQVLPATQVYRPTDVTNAIDPASLSKGADLMDSTKNFETLGIFQMHDLVRDLGRYVGGEEIAFVSFDTVHQVSTRVRHLVWTEENCFGREFPSQLLTASKARSLQLATEKKGGHMSTSFLRSLIFNFRCLRILSLVGFEVEELPSSIGDSKHLRYLNLASSYKLKRLPDSISKLVNLQTLNVKGCRQLERFPRNLHRCINLRHLYFTSNLDSCLETSYHGWTSMQNIRISSCEYLTSLSEKIGTLTTLRILQIMHCPNLDSLPNSIRLLIALERLEICQCEKLNLSGWQGLNGLRSLQVLIIFGLPLLVQFPNGLQHCTSLSKLIINFCKNLSTLPRGIETLKSLENLSMIGISLVLWLRCNRYIGIDWKLIKHIRIIHVLPSQRRLSSFK